MTDTAFWRDRGVGRGLGFEVRVDQGFVAGDDAVLEGGVGEVLAEDRAGLGGGLVAARFGVGGVGRGERGEGGLGDFPKGEGARRGGFAGEGDAGFGEGEVAGEGLAVAGDEGANGGAGSGGGCEENEEDDRGENTHGWHRLYRCHPCLFERGKTAFSPA